MMTQAQTKQRINSNIIDLQWFATDSGGPSHTSNGSSYKDIDRVSYSVAFTQVAKDGGQSVHRVFFDGRQVNELKRNGGIIYQRGYNVFSKIRQTTTWENWSDGVQRNKKTSESVLQKDYRKEYL